MNTYIAIDQGTTSSRAILFSDKGSIISTSQLEFEQIYPQSGWVEHNSEEIWETTQKVTSDIIEIASSANYSINGIGITNQRETTILWDKKTGKPVYNAIVWQDRRTSDFCKKLSSEGLENIIQKKTGLTIDPYFSASKICWILDNVPHARERAELGEILFGTVDSFLLWKLTEGKVHSTDATNAARTSLYNIESLEWDEKLLEIFNVPKNILPDVKDSSYHFGYTTEGAIGKKIPILSILGDQQAAAVGQACFSEGSIKSTYGTGCFVILNTGNKFIKSKSKLLGTICYKINNKPTYALEGSIFISGAVIQWLRDGLKIINSAQETEKISQSLESNDGVYLVPAFTGFGCPYWDPDARGAIYGISRDTGPKQFIRAALESVAYQTRDLFKAMSEDGIEPKNIRVDGGMTVNNWLMQFLSDVLNVEIQRPKITETTALGVAMMAALTDNRFSSLEEIATCWKLDKKFTPSMKDTVRKDLLSKWDYYVSKTLTRKL